MQLRAHSSNIAKLPTLLTKRPHMGGNNVISVAFALAVATSAEAMSSAPLREPNAMITQIRKARQARNCWSGAIVLPDTPSMRRGALPATSRSCQPYLAKTAEGVGLGRRFDHVSLVVESNLNSPEASVVEEPTLRSSRRFSAPTFIANLCVCVRRSCAGRWG